MRIVERTGELLTLQNLLTPDRDRPGKVVLIEGAAATGKTTLMHAFAARAVEAGAAFLSASASPAERELPLSAVNQLFHDPALPPAEVERADRLIQDGSLTVRALGVRPAGGAAGEAAAQVPAPILSRLTAIVLKAAEQRPLVVGVDDIHHADAASVQFLLYLARRIGTARVVLVLTECLRPTRSHSLLHTDLLREPHCRRLRLRPLSEEGVAELLAEHVGTAIAARLAPECHRVTGGNPLLVNALIEDHRMAEPTRPVSLTFGDAFRQAVLTCLYRAEATTLARAIAVLPGGVSGGLLGELVDADAASVVATCQVLQAAGLLDAESFRHEALRAAVLGGMRPDERTALHLRAAELLHRHGAPAAVVAERLLAADRARAPWAVAVLRDAAEQAFAEGRVADATDLLRLALRECGDDDQRPAVQLDLARAEWRIDPATAARHLPDLVRGLRRGRLPAGGGATLVSWMLWLGRPHDALEILTEVSGGVAVPHADPGRRAERGPCAEPSPWWLPYAYPGLTRLEGLGDILRPPGDAPDTSVPVPVAPSPRTEAMLVNALSRGAVQEAVQRAEQLLEEAGPAFRSPLPVAAIAALVYADELDAAERWCDTLGRSTASWPPQGRALLMAMRALVHQARGRLESAVKCAREALTLMTPKGWGVVIAIPLATMVVSLTAAGRYEEVEEYLDMPLPEGLFHSPFVLPHLQARGRYYLAINRPKAALAEFRTCGELMTVWGFDLPGLVPWRTDMAQAHLVLGDRQNARRLAAEQLRMLSPAQARTRGATLRTLAAASDADRRTELITEAVELLERSGDRLELARALADLSELYQATGQERRARAVEQRARALAAECGAGEIGGTLSPRLAGADERGENAGPDLLHGLSVAELRVAALAVDGYTNRQIARRLHVTTSTVEQHLTKVYRKLQISRRTDLPVTLLLQSTQDFPA
ncbi:helix-turn-helix transcriptional regulator [Actinomadura keratinilytica]|uniref:LuxR family transcriptional regulator n=1 Tax=Actinomadura keratinilytica TaxID=547461 RepID=A0ABP7YCX4_9ACTN